MRTDEAMAKSMSEDSDAEDVSEEEMSHIDKALIETMEEADSKANEEQMLTRNSQGSWRTITPSLTTEHGRLSAREEDRTHPLDRPLHPLLHLFPQLP